MDLWLTAQSDKEHDAAEGGAPKTKRVIRVAIKPASVDTAGSATASGAATPQSSCATLTVAADHASADPASGDGAAAPTAPVPIDDPFALPAVVATTAAPADDIFAVPAPTPAVAAAPEGPKDERRLSSFFASSFDAFAERAAAVPVTAAGTADPFSVAAAKPADAFSTPTKPADPFGQDPFATNASAPVPSSGAAVPPSPAWAAFGSADETSNA